MKRILIANRGEIAVRIIRACRDSGRVSIAVYADSDANAEFVRLADEAYPLEGSSSAQTYLNVPKLLEIAKRSGADGVHPGYGFLAENADFARAVQSEGFVWIGPPPAAIDVLGDKVAARRLADQVGAPLVPGTADPISSPTEAVEFARQHGFPITIKAAYGGGGRGLRVVTRLSEVAEQYAAVVREATQAFGRGECFVERYLDKARHVEVQVLADTHGTVVAVGTRDCTLQRRNQKLIEEAPAPFLTADQEHRLTSSAVAICAAAGYVGAGTVEYLLAEDGTLAFLEVNTRLQVEHPVTEEVTGLDLVLEQFQIAEGGRIDSSQPVVRGHAIEFRINAEDPSRGFLPVPGELSEFVAPAGPGVRLDSGVVPGSVVSGDFDSMLAKLIIWGPSREIALARSRRALRELVVEGVPTVIPFDLAVLDEPAFTGEADFGVHTRWIETNFLADVEKAPLPEPPIAGDIVRTWIEVDGRRVRLGLPVGVVGAGAIGAVRPEVETTPEQAVPEGAVLAPVTGTVVRWIVDDGAEVNEGLGVVIVESMKMETIVHASRPGILSVDVAEGDFVSTGTVLGIIR